MEYVCIESILQSDINFITKHCFKLHMNLSLHSLYMKNLILHFSNERHTLLCSLFFGRCVQGLSLIDFSKGLDAS